MALKVVKGLLAKGATETIAGVVKLSKKFRSPVVGSALGDEVAVEIANEIDFNLLATLGLTYGGILNNTEAKVAGKAYYDTTGKKLYKCIANTSINYADAVFFEAVSNNDLLVRLNSLKKVVHASSRTLSTTTTTDWTLIELSIPEAKVGYVPLVSVGNGSGTIAAGSVRCEVEVVADGKVLVRLFNGNSIVNVKVHLVVVAP